MLPGTSLSCSTHDAESSKRLGIAVSDRHCDTRSERRQKNTQTYQEPFALLDCFNPQLIVIKTWTLLRQENSLRGLYLG
jgi:hypothetical protein